MGLVFSAFTYFIASSFWNPASTEAHGFSFHLKITNDELFIQDEQLCEQSIGDFSVLPNEMIVHILSFLEILSILRLSSACKLMYKVISSTDAIWETILSRLDLSSYQIQLLKSNAEYNQQSMKLRTIKQHIELRVLRPVFQQHAHMIKATILGSKQVGKTQLANRLLGFPFDPVHRTTTCTTQSWTKFRCYDGSIARLIISDCPPYVDGPNLVTTVRNSHLLLLVFDITRYETFLRCNHYFKITEWALSSFHIVLIGTHLDCDEQIEDGLIKYGENLDNKRQVPYDEAKKMAEDRAIQYFEISLKTGEELPELLGHLVYHTRRFADFLRDTPTNIRG